MFANHHIYIFNAISKCFGFSFSLTHLKLFRSGRVSRILEEKHHPIKPSVGTFRKPLRRQVNEYLKMERVKRSKRMKVGKEEWSVKLPLLNRKDEYWAPRNITYSFDNLNRLKERKQIDTQSDMENVQNFIQAGLFISRFYPKVREFQFQNRDETA